MNSFSVEFLGWISLLLVLTIALALLRSPRALGRSGERRVARLMRRALNGEPAFIFRDVTLSTDRGSSQIDVLAITLRGVFVIEVKNLKGKISGGPQRKYWRVQLGRRGYRLRNPLHQNHGHLKAVQRTLEIPRDQLLPLVVILGRSTLSNKIRELVLRPDEITTAVKSRAPDQLSASAVDALARRIEAARLPPGRATDRLHLKNVRQQLRANRGPLPCPRCGAAMQKRTNRKGANPGNAFWGCERFPRCRVTRELTAEQYAADSEFPAQPDLGNQR